MAKYHAMKNNLPLCGARGTGDRFNVICLPPKGWNALPVGLRCEKCIAKIQAMRNKQV